MNDTAEVYTDDAHPNVRVRLVYDFDPHQPDGDVYAPAVRLADYRGRFDYLSEFRPADLDAGRISDAWDHLRDWGKLARWLRMFYGVTTVEQFSNGHNDVTMLVFDTPDWRAHVGVEVTAAEPAGLSGDVNDWQAWLDGEVFGVIVETRATATTVVRDTVTGDVIREETADVWEHEDSTYGYYGTEHAELEARQQLAEYIRDTTLADDQVMGKPQTDR